MRRKLHLGVAGTLLACWCGSGGIALGQTGATKKPLPPLLNVDDRGITPPKPLPDLRLPNDSGVRPAKDEQFSSDLLPPLDSTMLMPLIPNPPSDQGANPKVHAATEPGNPIIGPLPAVPGVPQNPPAVPASGTPGRLVSNPGQVVEGTNAPTTTVGSTPGAVGTTPGAVISNPPTHGTIYQPSLGNGAPTGSQPYWDPTATNPLGTPTAASTRGPAISPKAGPLMWGSAEYLLWFVQKQKVPNIVSAIAVQNGQTVGNPITLFPEDDGIDFSLLSGVRGTVGGWFDGSQTIGAESSYFWFGRNSEVATFLGNNDFALGHLFFDTANNRQSLYQIAFPGSATGSSTVRSVFRLEGGDSNLLFASPEVGNWVQAILGFRYLNFRESLRIEDQSVNTSNGQSFFVVDKFAARNQFFGGQVGLRFNLQADWFTFSLTGKIAYGAMNETVSINGYTTQVNGNTTTTGRGGIYALETNIGTHTRTRTVFVPEVNANLGWRLMPWATAYLGYNFLFLTEVVRPGRHIDTNVNSDNYPFVTNRTGATSTRPEFRFSGESIWLQGINFGLTFEY